MTPAESTADGHVSKPGNPMIVLAMLLHGACPTAHIWNMGRSGYLQKIQAGNVLFLERPVRVCSHNTIRVNTGEGFSVGNLNSMCSSCDLHRQRGRKMVVIRQDAGAFWAESSRALSRWDSGDCRHCYGRIVCIAVPTWRRNTCAVQHQVHELHAKCCWASCRAGMTCLEATP